MTEPADFEAIERALPGLDEPKAGESALKLATRRTIAALKVDGLIGERHSVILQLMLELADVIASGVRAGKAAAVGMASAQMLAAYQLLLPDAGPGGEDDDAWNELVADLRRGAAAARDATQP